jgi:hypothetical protein
MWCVPQKARASIAAKLCICMITLHMYDLAAYSQLTYHHEFFKIGPFHDFLQNNRAARINDACTIEFHHCMYVCVGWCMCVNTWTKAFCGPRASVGEIMTNPSCTSLVISRQKMYVSVRAYISNTQTHTHTHYYIRFSTNVHKQVRVCIYTRVHTKEETQQAQTRDT